jgi:predicted RNA binding protein YcfA (HicA-like mRNA interferase family)
MKCSEILRLLKKDGWMIISSRGSHLKLKHPVKKGLIIFPDHGAKEMGKGLEKKIFKDADLKK